MSCTLDKQTLNVTDWSWDDSYLGSQVTQWKNGAVTRSVNVLGATHLHKITCIEKNVAWASSLAQYFRGKINGATLKLNSTLNIYSTGGDVNVYVLAVSGVVSSRDPGEGNALIRRFTLTIQEA